MTDPYSLTQARCSAVECLTRREYASEELRNKLKRKGFEQSVIDCVLIQLREDNLLSDERFVESFVRTQSNKGYGPLRIQQELQKRGLSGEWVKDLLKSHQVDWMTHARIAREKHFGYGVPQNQREFAKQVRFLQNRGFTEAQIHSSFSCED
jgi:regulatory protein